MSTVVDASCWYCLSPAAEVWHTTWDEPGQEWPMCETHSCNVRRALALRAEGRHAEADDADESSGISTDKYGSQWIPPAVAERV